MLSARDISIGLGQLHLTLQGHGSRVWAVAFNPQLMGDDTSAKLVDLLKQRNLT